MEEDAVARRQTEILTQLAALIAKVEQNITELKLLRIELGLDSVHGRIPMLESNLSRHDNRLDKMESSIDKLKEAEAEDAGRAKLFNGIIALLGGGAAGAILDLCIRFIK